MDLWIRLAEIANWCDENSSDWDFNGLGTNEFTFVFPLEEDKVKFEMGMIISKTKIGRTYIARILDSEWSKGNFANVLQWLRKEEIDYFSEYEPDGDHDGFWAFRFESEEDKVKFILRWF